MDFISCKLQNPRKNGFNFWQAKKAQKHEFGVYKLKKHDVNFLQATESLEHKFQVLQV